MSNYSIEEHTHRFAIWTSARAASKSRLKNKEVAGLIIAAGVQEAVDQLRLMTDLADEVYNAWIKALGEKLLAEVEKTDWLLFKRQHFSFGLAAKIISIYIKTIEVIPTQGKSLLSLIAYPPIDSILIKNINIKRSLKLKHTWSTFNWDDYNTTIQAIKIHYAGLPMWMVESDWEI